MSFVHFYLLGGMALVGVPILIHLVTREKPKHLRFPAFRFLVQKYHINRRKLRLHHLLLLLLRMLLIAALCMALARPRLHTELPEFFGGKQPVDVVLAFDTSPSMEYERGGLTRLEDARRRALELLDDLPRESRVAVIDSAQPAGEFQAIDTAHEAIKALQVRADNAPVSRLIDRAYTLFQSEDEKGDTATEPAPRYLYVFSDRTRASWDPADVRGLKMPEGVNIVYIDVGAEKPTDLAIEQIIVDPPAVTPGNIVRVRAVILATGEKADRTITCQLDGDAQVQRKGVQIEEGARQSVTFEYRAADLGVRDGVLKPGPHQVVIRIDGTDRLPFNNVNYATFVVRLGRKVLTLMDELPDVLEPWESVLAVPELGYSNTSRTIKDLDKLKPNELNDYDLVCLYQVSDPTPAWRKLYDYVSGGGKLAIIPAGPTAQKAAYNDGDLPKKLLPGTLDQMKNAPNENGLLFNIDFDNKAPLMAPFVRWKREKTDLQFWKTGGKPLVFRYWQVTPFKEGRVITTYGDAQAAALLERDVGPGRVLLFTTKLDAKKEMIFPGQKSGSYWQNFWLNAFGVVLIDKACRYLAGDSVAPDWNYISGATINIPVPREGGDKFLLRGPGLAPAGVPLTAPDAEARAKGDVFLPISRAVLPGNYLVYSVRNDRQDVLEGFSLNVRPEESLLLPRIPKEEIEEFLGKDSVLGLEHNISLREAIGRKPKPVELLPWLMLALLLFLALENFWANRSREKPPPEAPPGSVAEERPAASVSSSWRPMLLVIFWTGLGIVIGAILSLMRGGPSASLAAGAFITGLCGLFHGLLSYARFGPREGAILGGLLGSIVGVLYGWLILGAGDTFDPMLAIFTSLCLGAGVMAADGWFLGTRAALSQPPRAEDRNDGPDR